MSCRVSRNWHTLVRRKNYAQEGMNDLLRLEYVTGSGLQPGGRFAKVDDEAKHLSTSQLLAMREI